MKKKVALGLVLGALAVGSGSMAGSTPVRIDSAPTKVTKPASKGKLGWPGSTPKGTTGPMCPPISGCA